MALIHRLCQLKKVLIGCLLFGVACLMYQITNLDVLHKNPIMMNLQTPSGNIRDTSISPGLQGSTAEEAQVEKNMEPLPLCAELNITSAGRIPVFKMAKPLRVLEKRLTSVLTGGRWLPNSCQSRHHVALLIPYRNRDVHLRILMRHIHPFLQRQNLEYTIFIICQTEGSKFNRGTLFNIGYREATSRFPGYFDCFILHDVDLLPEDDRISYGCTASPRHLSTYINKFKYRMIYKMYTGGVLEISTAQYNLTNGFSNLYFGWGGEDDDFSKRMNATNLRILRFPSSWGRYTMIKHMREEIGKDRFAALSHAIQRRRYDGLNTLNYTLISWEERPLYTNITVAINEKHIVERYAYEIKKQKLRGAWMPLQYRSKIRFRSH